MQRTADLSRIINFLVEQMGILTKLKWAIYASEIALPLYEKRDGKESYVDHRKAIEQAKEFLVNPDMWKLHSSSFVINLTFTAGTAGDMAASSWGKPSTDWTINCGVSGVIWEAIMILCNEDRSDIRKIAIEFIIYGLRLIERYENSGGCRLLIADQIKYMEAVK